MIKLVICHVFCTVKLTPVFFCFFFYRLGDHEIDGGFVSQTCWIQGVYVYKELKDRIDEVAYFGIPKDITYDGFLKGSEKNALCNLQPKLNDKREDCEPMSKTFYLQVCFYLFIFFY